MKSQKPLTINEYFNFDSKIYDNCKSIEDKFKIFAQYLLNQVEIKINDNTLTIEEIEIYYYNPKEHKDEYTHKNKDQLTNSMWYFHQYHNGTYKSGTYKGMDITFGTKQLNIYGGALIRSINNSTTNEFITGPCNTVNYILKMTDCKEVEDLVAKMSNLDIFNSKNPFYLTVNNKTNNENNTIFTGPRVGLSWKYPEYLVKEYRYLKQPSKIPKNRGSIISSLYNKGIKSPEIEKLTGISKASVSKSINEFTEGGKLKESEVKKLKHDKINIIFGYYCGLNKQNNSEIKMDNEVDENANKDEKPKKIIKSKKLTTEN